MKTVVIIDDEVEMTLLLERLLKRLKDVNVRTFNDPARALSYLQSSQVTLVISDIMMPGMDGLELLQKIKELSKPPKVIMMTAEATLERVLKSHKYDARDFLTKPIDMNALQQRVQFCLE